MNPPIPIKDFSSYLHYFTAMAHQHCGLDGSICIGDSWRIIGKMRGSIRYPAMWLEYPELKHGLGNDGDTVLPEVRCALSIVGGVAKDDWEGQDNRLQECQQIIAQVIARLKRDADLNHFDLGFPITAEPLATVMADDLYGWRIEFTMARHQWNVCFEEEVWVGLDYAGTDYTGIDFDVFENFTIQP
ncbi:MAG: hypothetical protein AAFX78_14690 [Cyanobacteria bacterium J06638_20]